MAYSSFLEIDDRLYSNIGNVKKVLMERGLMS